jgi:hypothetical protein
VQSKRFMGSQTPRFEETSRDRGPRRGENVDHGLGLEPGKENDSITIAVHSR